VATFTFHTIDTAPAKSKPLLEDSLKNFGMIPNLHAVMAESPAVLDAYKSLHESFQNTSFDKDEDALRNRSALPNAKLQALHNMTLSMTRNRGRLQDAEVDAFFAAGYTQRHMLEIALGLSQKVMSNYVNHFSETPVDDAFAEFAWDGANTA